jgi:L-ascorbate metabolism protein UlaG (beta-lactamase superfamily)
MVMKDIQNSLKNDVGLSSLRFSWMSSITAKLGLPIIILGGIVLMGINNCAGFGGTIKGERLQIISSSPQYSEGQFQNPVSTTVWGEQAGTFRLIKRFLTTNNDEREPAEQLPIKPITKEILSQKPKNGLRVFWLGHSSVLVEIDGYRVLTDPVFSDRVTPIQPLGPKRFHPNPIAIDDMPDIDAVVISHDHYDHLDQKSIELLAKNKVKFFVPLGVGAHLESWDVPAEQIVELDLWQEVRIDKLLLTATPSRHFSGRGVWDRDKTLWVTWSIAGPQHRVFFGGDTGMFPGFAEIGKKLGPFDITLMPIGAYDLDWPYIHLFPEEAVQAHIDLRGKLLLPIHWGTFNLAFHPWREPVDRLQSSAAARQILVALPLPGEAVEIDKKSR